MINNVMKPKHKTSIPFRWLIQLYHQKVADQIHLGEPAPSPSASPPYEEIEYHLATR